MHHHEIQHWGACTTTQYSTIQLSLAYTGTTSKGLPSPRLEQCHLLLEQLWSHGGGLWGTTAGLLHLTAPHYTTLHYTKLYCTTQHYTAPQHTPLYCTTQHYTAPQHTTLYSTTQHYTVPHNTTLHHTTQHYCWSRPPTLLHQLVDSRKAHRHTATQTFSHTATQIHSQTTNQPHSHSHTASDTQAYSPTPQHWSRMKDH